MKVTEDTMDNINQEQTKWEKLTIANDFVFGKVMQNKRLCKKLLEIILKVKIRKIEYPELQKAVDIAVDAKSVRLDVYVEDENNTVYDIEIQAINTKELPKRSRFYHGMIDLNLINKGAHYSELRKCYVIFICLFDPFKTGRHIYTFEHRCKEDPSITLGDESTTIFLNAKGKLNDVDDELHGFLSYVASGMPESDFALELDKNVQEIKSNEKWRLEYMTLFMRDQENLRQGIEKGRKEGREEGREEGRNSMIINVLKNIKNIEQAASILSLPIDLVEKVARDNQLSF
jgi:predicted transposase/invertase (TIGR01784 family)